MKSRRSHGSNPYESPLNARAPKKRKTEANQSPSTSEEQAATLPSLLNISDYPYFQKLGSGGNANVFAGFRSNDGRKIDPQSPDPVAIKKIKYYHSNNEQRVKKEAFILNKLKNSPNINQFIGCDHDPVNNIFYILLEYLPHTLRDVLDYSSPWPWIHRLKIAEGIVTGLCSIHENGFMHCDIKPNNILIKPGREYDEVKICDFGNSRFQHEKPLKFLGVYGYGAPELLHLDYSPMSDIFAVAMTLLEVFNWKLARLANRLETLKKYAEGWRPKLNELPDNKSDHDIANALKHLGIWASQTPPYDRPTAPQMKFNIEKTQGFF